MGEFLLSPGLFPTSHVRRGSVCGRSSARFPWAVVDRLACEHGRAEETGYPMVDAGMRELWHTGCDAQTVCGCWRRRSW